MKLKINRNDPNRKTAEIIIPSIELTESILEGKKYNCIIIKAGQTETANAFTIVNGLSVPIYKYYTEEALQEAVEKGLFENIIAVWRSTDEHLSGQNTGINQIVGTFTEVKWNPELKQVEGIFNIKQGGSVAESFKTWLGNLYQKTKQIGLSISGIGKYIIEAVENKYIAIVTEIESLQSIDPVPVGNAGGKLLQIIESQINKFSNQNLTEMNQELKTLIFNLLDGALLIKEGLTVEAADDGDLVYALYNYCYTLLAGGEVVTEAQRVQIEKINEFINKKELTIPPKYQKILAEAAKKKIETAPITERELTDEEKAQVKKLTGLDAKTITEAGNEVKRALCEANLTLQLEQSKLPQIFRDKVRKHFTNRIFEYSELTEALKDEQKILSEIRPNLINNGGHDIKPGKAGIDKVGKQLEYMLLSKFVRENLTESQRKEYKDAGVDVKFNSIKELVGMLTGNSRVTRLTEVLQNGLLAEALVTSDLATIFKNALNKSMVLEYTFSAYSQDWRKVCSNIVPRMDFKTNTVGRLGGYGNLEAVAESGTYQAFDSPTDEEVTYAVSKYGNLETITLEMIKNDDMGKIGLIPKRMGQAAARTLYEFVMDLIITNPVMDYDTVALFNAAHDNLLNSALDATTFSAARQRMVRQTELDSDKRIGINPKYLLVPVELQQTAYELTVPAFGQANQVPKFYQTWQVEPIVIAHTTDTDNWYLEGNPSECSTIEVGFLDGNEEPEVFEASNPQEGAYFTDDEIRYKIRHIYGGDVLDHRAFVGSIF